MSTPHRRRRLLLLLVGLVVVVGFGTVVAVGRSGAGSTEAQAAYANPLVPAAGDDRTTGAPPPPVTATSPQAATPAAAAGSTAAADLAAADITGTYDLNRTIVFCHFAHCDPSPLILRIDCGGGECAVHNADNSWVQPHPLTHDGATWRTSGPEEGQVYCNGEHVRDAMITMELTVVSADMSGGASRAENLTGTLSVSAPMTTTGCPAGNSQFAMTGSAISR